MEAQDGGSVGSEVVLRARAARTSQLEPVLGVAAQENRSRVSGRLAAPALSNFMVISVSSSSNGRSIERLLDLYRRIGSSAKGIRAKVR